MLTVIILAAGKGTRMKSDTPKVLFEAAGKPMLDYVLELSRSLGAQKIVTVVGSGADSVMSHAKADDVEFCIQKEQLGTAHAVKTALANIDANDGRVLILCGDMPLIKADVIKDFIEKADSGINFVSVKTDDPKGYGRVVRNTSGGVMKIVEEKDANANEKKINEVNTGVYLADIAELRTKIADIGNDNAQKEYYLTDIVKNGAKVYLAEKASEYAGINDRVQLAAASKILWRERAEKFMRDGVSVLDPDTLYADLDVTIERDAVIHPNVTLSKGTKIGSGCEIFSGCRIVDSVIESNCDIKDNSLIESASVGSGSSVGPMAHLRPGSVLSGDNKVGNFVELKKTIMGIGSKASHLTYLGDAELGRNVNVGCGTITCNYDGYNKFKTVIGDDVFVGSDVQFVAPITVGAGALIAAGSTITADVPADALALTRAEQRNIEGKAKQINERNKNKKR